VVVLTDIAIPPAGLKARRHWMLDCVLAAAGLQPRVSSSLTLGPRGPLEG